MRTTTFLLAGLAVAGAGIAFELALENRRLRSELARRRSELASEPAQASTTGQALADGPAAADHAASPPAMADPVSATTADRALAEGRRRWDDPGARAQRFDAAVLQVDRKYGRLFQRLGLSPDLREALRRQLAAHELALADAALPDAVTMDEAQAAARLQAMKRIDADNEQRLRALLGDEACARFDAFSQAEAYRATVAPLANAMRAGGLLVDADLEDAMLSAYATAFRLATERAAADPAAPARLTDAERQAVKRRQVDALHVEMMRQLSTVLTPAQLDAFMQAQLEAESLP